MVPPIIFNDETTDILSMWQMRKGYYHAIGSMQCFQDLAHVVVDDWRMMLRQSFDISKLDKKTTAEIWIKGEEYH